MKYCCFSEFQHKNHLSNCILKLIHLYPYVVNSVNSALNLQIYQNCEFVIMK